MVRWEVEGTRAGGCLCGSLKAEMPTSSSTAVSVICSYHGLSGAVVCDMEKACAPSAVFKPWQESGSHGRRVKKACWPTPMVSQCQEWRMRMCSSSKFSGPVDVTGVGTTL